MFPEAGMRDIHPSIQQNQNEPPPPPLPHPLDSA
jgi:hypothetical protein